MGREMNGFFAKRQFRVFKQIQERKRLLDMRDKKRTRVRGTRTGTKNGRRVRAFDRRGEHLCVVNFLILLLLLLFYGDERERFSNFCGFRIHLLFVSLPQ